MTTSVLVIDHNPILLEGIACLIRAEPDMVLAGTAVSLHAGLTLAGHLRPDCIVIDLDMHSEAGFEVTTRISKNAPAVPIIGLITYELDDRVSDALASGVSTVLGKDQISQTLVDLIRKVSRLA